MFGQCAVRRQSRLGVVALAAALALIFALPGMVAPARADAADDCTSEDNERRISGCTELLMQPGLEPDAAALAYAMRALANSLKGRYEDAIVDFDRAISIKPNFAVALNNRAWALFRAGKAERGVADVERSLAIQPLSPHALDTRAHIRQQLGQTAGAIADYDLAMRVGGQQIIKLYQCGLQASGHYKGDLDGVYSAALKEALQLCVSSRACDPLPPDEECRKMTS